MKHILNNITINYEHHDEVDSTQILAKKALDNMELNEYYLTSTLSQTQAIGTQERVWHSLQGNVGISLGFLVESIDKVKLLPFVAALSIHRYLNTIAIHSNIKWPNDILVDGKKIAGILVQSYSNISPSNPNYIGICLGLGINVNATSEDLKILDKEGTSIFIETKVKREIKELSKNIGISLIQDVRAFLNDETKDLISQVNERLEKFDNQIITIYTDENNYDKGSIRKLNADGSINLKLLDGSEKSFSYGRIIV